MVGWRSDAGIGPSVPQWSSVGQTMRTELKICVVAFALAFGLTACGKRASLDNPPDPAANKTATAESGQGKPEGAGAGGHKPFILDGLIR